VKLVHLVGFITKKFVTMHSHMKVKFSIFNFAFHISHTECLILNNAYIPCIFSFFYLFYFICYDESSSEKAAIISFEIFLDNNLKNI